MMNLGDIIISGEITMVLTHIMKIQVLYLKQLNKKLMSLIIHGNSHIMVINFI